MKNLIFNKAQKVKNDEFYTKYNDIEKELIHYKDFLKDKNIICPCDTAESNFVKFLQKVGKAWGINSLTWSWGTYEKIDYSKFDVVITNPPFSKFTHFMETIKNVSFIIVGSNMVGTLKSINKMFIVEEITTGYTTLNEFNTPDGEKQVECYWYTNLNISKNQFSHLNDIFSHYQVFNGEKYEVIYKMKNFNFSSVNKMIVPVNFLKIYSKNHHKIHGLIRPIKDGKKGFVKYIVSNK